MFLFYVVYKFLYKNLVIRLTYFYLIFICYFTLLRSIIIQFNNP